MAKAKLDHLFCLTAQCEPGKKKTDYWDTHIPGFVLECRAGGTATYAMRYTDEAGKQRQHKIGRLDAITNAQARKEAQRIRAQVELGGNPRGDKETLKAIPTYAIVAAQHANHNEAHLRSHADANRIIELHLLPRWGMMRLNDIKTQDISGWLKRLIDSGKAPATVEKIRVTFNRSFELALKWNIPGAELNPVKAVPRIRFNNKREKYLTNAEATRLLAACEESPNPQLKSIVQLLLLTGARKNELLQARWQHIDFERCSWLIPDSKTGKPRYVPLSTEAMAVIEQLPRFGGCPWLLPNPRTKLPFTDIKHPWETARDKAGLPGLRIHDLRHSAASFMVNAGVDLFAVGKVLGHADYQSTMRYSHLNDATLRDAVEKGAAKMKGLAYA